MSRVRPRTERSKDMDAPPAPASRGEAAKYQLLLSKLQGDFRVAEAMITNEQRRHGELNRNNLSAALLSALSGMVASRSGEAGESCCQPACSRHFNDGRPSWPWNPR